MSNPPDTMFYDCKDLLQEIKQKYPEALSEVLSSLKEIRKHKELETKIKRGEPTYSKEIADYWLKQLTGYGDE